MSAVSDMLNSLDPKGRRGSKLRCHLLTHGTPAEVAPRLDELAGRFAAVTPDDRWMPQGFDELEEAQLDRAPRLLDPELGSELRRWWLGTVDSPGRTPNFDIASTCRVDGVRGLLLVEAKAHDQELIDAAAGRARRPPSDAGDATREAIGAAIREARNGLEVATALEWGIDRDSHYQLSNRVAWAWKLAMMGIPVVLVYLGFLDANEMADKGNPIGSHAEWTRLVRQHAAGVVPGAAWDRALAIGEVPLVLSIRSASQPLPTDCMES